MREGVASFDPAALRRIRERAGLSQQALATNLGLARTNYIGYETSRLRPSSKLLAAMARALEVHPSALTTVTAEHATLKDLRQWSGLSHREIDERLGASGYGRVERGQRALPERHVAPLARLFGVTVTRLRAALATS